MWFFRIIVQRETEVLQGLYLVLLFAACHRLLVSLLLVGYNSVLCGQGYVGIEAAHAFHIHVLFAGGCEYQVHAPCKGKEHQRETIIFLRCCTCCGVSSRLGLSSFFGFPSACGTVVPVLILLYFFHIAVCLTG